MQQVITKQFHPVDAKLMKFRDRKLVNYILARTPYYFENLAEGCEGNFYTVFKNEEICFLAGWTPSLLNYCDIFFFASQNLKKLFDREVYQAMKMILNKCQNEWERAQTWCAQDDINKRFLEFLGFKQECLMQKYGPNGEDAYLYARIREGEQN
ncbi:MAG: hypothetical protein LBQ08_05080 [Holosporaceae bacterium]|jgi:hypothetical protein|nr:hypothetical protein [Holosporaceae bacterium]